MQDFQNIKNVNIIDFHLYITFSRFLICCDLNAEVVKGFLDLLCLKQDNIIIIVIKIVINQTSQKARFEMIFYENDFFKECDFVM